MIWSYGVLLTWTKKYLIYHYFIKNNPNMAVFPTLDFMQIKARYPKAVEKIQKWVFEQPELQSVTDEFIDPKDPEKSKEMFVGLMIQMDPRKLYDIFDSFK